MSEAVEGLFRAIRGACSAGTWSRGVELARAEAVTGERDDGGEIALRVATRGGLVSPTTILYPDDEAWECACGGREDVCEHVAAAVIALRRARGRGEELPRGRAGGRVGYRLARAGDVLRFERVVVADEKETPLASTIVAVASGRVDGPAVQATPDDLEVERALGSRLRGELPRGIWPTVLARLAACPDVRLDGTPVHASQERVGLVARLEDDGPGFRLRVAADPRVVERFRDGLVRLDDDTLCLEGMSALSGRERERWLGRGAYYGPEAAAELVTEVLPSLEGRLPLDVRTERLPRTTAEPPRLAVEVARDGDALVVFPTIVYGDPPIARVDAGRLIPLGGPIPLRDEAEERALARRLQNELELAPGRRIALQGEEALAMAESLRRFGDAVHGRALAGFARTGPLTPRFEAAGRDFSLAFERLDATGGAPARADPRRVLRAWAEGESWVPLDGGGFAPLPQDWLARHGARIADLYAARGERARLPAAALPDLARACEDLDVPAPEEAIALRARIEGEPPPAPLPEGLAEVLRSYQRAGVDWLCTLRDAGLGALLADDMGLGKTLQALCAVRGRTLVVAPTSVIHNWADEARRFRPDLRCAVYHGPGRALDPDADLTLTTYAILRLDAGVLADVAWDTVVLDEAQAIKNPESQAARAARGLRGGFRLALTGTPVENRLEELWSQLHFANPGLLGDRKSFDRRYARPIAAGEAGAAPRLRERIRPFVLRRIKREVAPELPPRTEVVLRAELTADERAVYDTVRAATAPEVAQRLTGSGGVMQALEALLRLRQAACHPSLVPGQTAESSSKLALLRDCLDQAVADGHRALVFSQWTSLLDLVEPELAATGIAYGRLDGATRDRAGVVKRFQADDGPPVLLLSLKAGGTGLNLTAADCVFILDPWWNPAAEDQAADRAHRIGQDRPVMIYRLVAADTVEEGILALQARKRGLAEAALGAAGQAAAITREELESLLL